jgi:hypothetical protein
VTRQGRGIRGLSALALGLGLAMALVVVPHTVPAGAARPDAAVADARTLWSRVHVIGASASAGFGVRLPAGRGRGARALPMTMARIAQCAALEGTAVTGEATGFFFADPCATGKSQVDELLALDPRPTVVFADDFLFWFAYGALDAERRPIKEEPQRMALLERGLAELARVSDSGIPVVVGDLPDMSESVGRMLNRAQMPQAGTLAQANARIRAWASGRRTVAVLPLARLVEDLRAGQPFDAGRRSWSEREDGPLIQRDRLHPTFAGTVALIARTEQCANERFLGIRQPNAPGAPSAFEHDPERVLQRARELSAEPAQRDGRPAQSAP